MEKYYSCPYCLTPTKRPRHFRSEIKFDLHMIKIHNISPFEYHESNRDVDVETDSKQNVVDYQEQAATKTVHECLSRNFSKVQVGLVGDTSERTADKAKVEVGSVGTSDINRTAEKKKID